MGIQFSAGCLFFSVFFLFSGSLGRVTGEICSSFPYTILLNVLADMPLISNLIADKDCYKLILVYTRNGKCGMVPQSTFQCFEIVKQ